MAGGKVEGDEQLSLPDYLHWNKPVVGSSLWLQCFPLEFARNALQKWHSIFPGQGDTILALDCYMWPEQR